VASRMTAHVTIKQYLPASPTNDNFHEDKSTTIVEEGLRRRWTKIAGPSEELNYATQPPVTQAPVTQSPVTQSPVTQPHTTTSVAPTITLFQALSAGPSTKPQVPSAGSSSKALPYLPYEIVAHVLDFAVEPLHHQAILTMDPETEVHPANMRLGVHKCRDWADISMYHVCQATRKTACRVYGQPTRESFPFDRIWDSLTINIDEEGTFVTGFPSGSTVINHHASKVTLRSLDGKVLIIDQKAVESFAFFTSSPTSINHSTPGDFSVTDQSSSADDDSANCDSSTVTDISAPAMSFDDISSLLRRSVGYHYVEELPEE
jgi:hypothetical protein